MNLEGLSLVGVKPLHALGDRLWNRLTLCGQLKLLLKQLQNGPGIFSLLLQVLLMDAQGGLLLLIDLRDRQGRGFCFTHWTLGQGSHGTLQRGLR